MTTSKKIVVIGGGLGGISAAISLAQSGFDVSLYEKNAHLGGKLNRLEQDGFGFDLGPSILTMPRIFERLFHRSDKRMSDYVTISRLDVEWRSFFPDGVKIDLHQNLQQMFSEHNPSLTPEDKKDYEKLLAYSKKLYDVTEKGYFGEGSDNVRDILKHHGMKETLTQFDLFHSMFDGIDKRIKNPHLRDMLAYMIKYVGSSPYDAPAILNMLLYMQHKEGAWYIHGGMHKLAEALVRLGKEVGVNFHPSTEISRLHTQDHRVVGAELANGEQIHADYFVSNMEVIPAYKHLLQEDEPFVEKLEKKFEPSSSGIVMHIGVNRTYPELAHHNFFYPDNLKEQMTRIFHDKQLPTDPTIYLVNVNKIDPSQAPAGCENIKILPHIPPIQDRPFTSADYEAFRDVVLTKLERMGLKDLRKHIITEDFWTPEDIERNYYSHRGSIYGTVSNKKINQGFKHPKQSSKYRNLYFVGGTVNPGSGMPMVTLSGQQVSERIVQAEQGANDD
ncbi:phytoene desaturase, neurosporene or lycopene producing [Geomicrobium sp. JCM 19037]|uniref:phytoene desaturase family protein n=1 Tax=Geomicrobium sp. JCM 19037 TaxID=1460634 RepID=UPI00045F4C02|nr:NAD(P)/FAD-dependent oxidoreductase [Geomicrobium sp. JCM 19037]GAK01891.1 phytoene desaturase, neurosporene or lycopene producing [Geomicrobium sp. JCM 19037]